MVLKLFDHKSVASDELLGTSTLPLSKLSNGKDKKPQTLCASLTAMYCSAYRRA